MNSIVFIPQEPMRKDGDGKWVSKGLNLAATSAYGDMCIVWGPDTSILSHEFLSQEARKVAARYDEDRDYIVALGSPSLIALLSWAIGETGKRLRMLEWDRSMKRYYPTLSNQMEKG
jgi:hypothetical protein